MSRIDASPWVREYLTRVEMDAIASVLPYDANLHLLASRRPGPHPQTFSALVTRAGRSAKGTGISCLSATLVALAGLEAAQ